MRARVCVFVALGIFLSLPVAHSNECPDEHTQALTRIWLYAFLTYPVDKVTVESVKRYRAVIDRATRPADALILRQTCSTLINIMYKSYGLEELRRLSNVYRGCPDDTVDLMLAEQQATNDPNTFDDELSDYLPIMRVSPAYPKKGLEQGLSGRVTMEFNVKKNGKVSRPKVTESTDKLFEKSAIAAVKRFKYNPRRKNGLPVETRGVRTAIKFTHPDDVEPSNCPEFGKPKLLHDDELAILSLTPDSD